MNQDIPLALAYDDGSKNIKELWKNAKFIRITPAGIRESASHDVIVN